MIEPKIRDEYLKNTYFWDVANPDDVLGDGTPGSAFRATYGDFYPNRKILGGMWDGLGSSDAGDYIVEIKTTKRAEDWLDGVPEYYKLQAALYTYLSGLDRFVVTGSFLEEKDYEDPSKFVPNSSNTELYDFSLAEEYPHFERDYIQPALDFWAEHVETGISPDFDEKVDAEALKALRTTEVNVSNASFTAMLSEYDGLQVEIADAMAKLEPKLQRQVELKKAIKAEMQSNFKDGDKYAEVKTDHFILRMTKQTKQTVDSKKLKADGIYDDYAKASTSYVLRENLNEEKAGN